jgi:uncharacterized membrane protein
LVLSRFLARLHQSIEKVKDYAGLKETLAEPTRLSLYGLGLTGLILILVGLWLVAVAPIVVATVVVALSLAGFGVFNLIAALRKELTLSRTNQLSLVGNLVLFISLYAIVSRFFFVSYTTDTVVGTYMGVLRALQLQSPYGYSIKPLLDKFGFSPAFYTPGVDGSFDFHLAYPSLSFLSIIPFYLLGLHDVRDTVFIFHIMSVLTIFALAPARLKSVSVLPFTLFSVVIAGSWTDSIWAFFLVLTAVLWYRHPKASWISLGFAVAVKQIAIVVAPFLLIRLWKETPNSSLRSLARNVGLMIAAFFLPNLPFIVSTPSYWWADVVAPFLPGAPSQVPGGIGLSGFLLDIGIALPSSFFLVLMGGVSGALLYLYAKHYRGLNSLVFAFPILIFFFYYRSFPNYMGYWLFPLVLELCRLGGPKLKLAFTPRLPQIAWRPPSGTFLRIFRRRFTPSVMVVMALTGIFAGVSGAYISQASNPRAAIQINGVMDPDGIGAATMIQVTVTNNLATPVSPIFFVKYSPLTYFWATNSSSILNSASSSSYTISAPDALSAVPRGDQFHIVIYDKLTGQLLGESSSFKADVPARSLQNPGLKWWILDPSVGTRVPFNWKLSPSNTDPVWSGISPLGVNGTSGLQIVLNYTSPLAGVERLSLSQKVLLNATNVSFHLNQSITTDIGSDLIFAASVSDSTHTLYYVFSDQTAQQTVRTYSTNTTIIMPTQRSQWTSITLSPESVWNAQGWTTPQQVTFTIFLESNAAGVYYASLDSITPA